MVLCKNVIIFFSICFVVVSNISSSSCLSLRKKDEIQKELDNVVMSKMFRAIKAHKKSRLNKIINHEVAARTRGIKGQNFEPITLTIVGLNCLKSQAYKENMARINARKNNK
ncbi:MAG: hypothetical protein NTU89_03355 [Candidatus Dependentiae bacterium]|nr:hypothetical protein [Candidatus Dependentiae bacterium]